MNRLKIFLLLILVTAGISFSACDDGGGSSSSKASLDARLVGQWEGDLENEGDVYYSIITITANNVFTNILLYPHDSPFDEKFWGLMYSGERGTITTGGVGMSITIKEDWDNAESNWFASDPYEQRNAVYGLSSDGNTLTVTIDGGDLIFTKGTAPAPDPNLTGTWVAHDLEDLEDDGTADEDVTLTATISSDGDYTMEKINTVTSAFIESETGTYGVYRDVEGNKYFVKTINSLSGSTHPTVSCYYIQRIEYLLNMFNDPDQLVMDPDGDALTFERQGIDPAVPAPDTALCGYWQGVEENGGTDYDAVIRLNADNSFEKVLLYQQTDPEHAGEMYGGARGEFMGNDGEFIINVDQEWSDGSWVAGDDFLDVAYSIEGEILTLASDGNTMTFNAIPAPAASGDLVGTWVLNTTEDWDNAGGDDNIRYTVVIDASGNISITLEDTDGTPFIYQYQTGTCGISAIDAVDYFTIMIEYSDDGTEAVPVTLPIAVPTEYYRVSRYPYVLDTAADPDVFTLNGAMVFEKQ